MPTISSMKKSYQEWQRDASRLLWPALSSSNDLGWFLYVRSRERRSQVLAVWAEKVKCLL